MNKDKLDRLYLKIGQIQELLEDGHVHNAKDKIEELRIELQNQVY